LNPEQVGTLFQLLREVHPVDGDQNAHVRKNGLMNALNRQGTLPPEALDLYRGIYRDPAQDDVIRDYAIQHVYEAYDKLADAGQRSAAAQLLHEAAQATNSSTAGTAILALARLVERDARVSRQEVAVVAFGLARDPNSNPSARISALQVVGRLDAAAAVPLLVQTVKNEPSVTLQLSAIGALGQCGGRAELALLRSIADGDKERLKPAALKAIQRIQERAGSI
jgi:HEAT repeat protein